jgi:hypothetical protein
MTGAASQVATVGAEDGVRSLARNMVGELLE